MKAKQSLMEEGYSAPVLREKLKQLKAGDVSWNLGKVFGFVYHPGEQPARISKEYLNEFLHENTLNPTTFPSLQKFEKEIVHMAIELMHGDKAVVGNVTSGGSESIFNALKVARDWALENRSMNKGEVVLPETAHPAFMKACHYLSLKPVIIPVDENKKANPTAMLKAINEQTILLACSAPCYPYGVVDPIEEIAQIAKQHNLFCHVDACMGGFMLPFIKDSGYPVPKFDFEVPGVTSISMDAHKYGYAPKGVSIVLYKNRNLRKKQFYIYTEWPGGIYASTTFMGTKSGGPIAGCWAVMKHLGRRGYKDISDQVMKSTEKILAGIKNHKHLHILGNPDMSVLAFTSDRGDIYNIGDALSARGWHLDRLQFPDALHMTINQLNIGRESEFLKDLDEILHNDAELKNEQRSTAQSLKVVSGLTKILPAKWMEKLSRKMGSNATGRGKSKQAAMYGISATFKDRKNVNKLVENLLDGMYS